MKTFQKITSVTLVLFLSVIITGFINPQKKVKLQLKLEENKTYKIENITEQEIIQDVMGMEQIIIQNYTTTYDYNVLEKKANGDMRIKITHTHIKFYQEMPMGTTEYDSKEDTDNIPDAAKGYAALLGESFEILITPMGKITEIKGVDEMIDNIFTKIGGSDLNDEQVKQSVKTQFGEDAMKSNIENSMAIYPKKAVKKGHTWNAENHIKSAFSMNVNYIYELVDIKNKLANIKLTSTLKTAEEDQEMDFNGVKMVIKLAGNQAGTLHVDITTGLIKESELTQDVEGDISMDMQGQEMKIPMKIKTIKKVKLLN